MFKGDVKKPRLSTIAAIGENRELGKKNELIWRIRDDLKRVKDLTTGHPIIMGQKTYESIGRPLPNRTNIVLTQDPDYRPEGCVMALSLEEALSKAQEVEDEEIFIFGGAYVYTQTIDMVDRLYLTRIHDTDPNADAFFPEYAAFTKVIAQELRDQDGLEYEWLTLERE
ncbi:dihydrofolate reductase [Candidatus Kaiserbacteria bacterium]|nr:dihydrofolate reductase [Candidatus Kaiserbacteria bacterium]